MTFSSIKGGFVLTDEQKQLLNEQRAITKQINDNFIQVGAIYLKASNKNPYDDDWYKHKFHDTKLQDWVDLPDLQDRNVGFNLQQGWMDVDIDASDPEFNRCILAAMQYLHVDTRFQFGRLSVGCATHVMVQLGEDESSNFDTLAKFEPREFTIDGKRYHVQLRSFPTGIKETNLATSSKQTVMPGSIYTHKTIAGESDISVWYTSDGKVARTSSKVAATTPRKVNFNEVVRAITFGVFCYVVKSEWVEGSRQLTANKVAGWLARVVADSQAMNNHEAIAKDVFCPIDTDDYAERLLEFVCDYMGDEEKHMRKRTYADAKRKLELNPDAKIPGWPSMEQLYGGAKVAALRTVLMPGSDVSKLTAMAERYLYDETDNRYIDRVRFRTTGNYVHAGDELERRHKGDTVRVGGKPREAFKLFESSDMRKRVGFRDLYPDLNPGGVYRISGLGDVLAEDSEEDQSALSVYNTWRGWPIEPTPLGMVDSALTASLVEKLDQVLNWLTRDNPNQVDWVKQWIAWTFQHPGDKQQIAWVVVGDQGIGKSWVGNVFLRQMMGNLWGSAAAKVLEGDFSVGPFKDKMLTFIDEAKFHSEIGTEEIKKLIRSVDVPGMEKFQEARNYRLFSRIMFASNRLNMGIGQTNVKDRALFYTRTYDRDFTHLTESEFRTWAETLKPFFTEFTDLMNQRVVREHFMRYFMDYPTRKYDIESIKHSSSDDAAIIQANMGWARRIAIYIVEDGRILEDMDISYPFTLTDFNKRVSEVEKELGFRNVQPAQVWAEYQGAGLVEPITVHGQRKLRFKHKIATLTEEFGKIIGFKLEPHFTFDEADSGANDSDGSKPVSWKGIKKGVVQSHKF